jgi:hypothetical protein
MADDATIEPDADAQLWAPLRVTFPVKPVSDDPELFGMALLVEAWNLATRDVDDDGKARVAAWFGSWLKSQAMAPLVEAWERAVVPSARLR